MVTPAARREAVVWIRDERGASERRACELASCARSVARYTSRRDPQEELRAKLREVAARKPRYGYRRLAWQLRREGLAVNDKRIYRLYRSEGLQVRKAKRKRFAAQHRPTRSALRSANERWAMDFLEDSLRWGRKLRTLSVLDEYTRECPAIEVDTSLPAERVVRLLDRLAQERAIPRELQVDNGPEYTSQALELWAYRHGVKLVFNRPGKPTDNPFIESYHGKFRGECLNMHWFLSVQDARQIIEAWRQEYNKERPHSSLGMLTPAEFAARRALPPTSPPAPGEPQTRSQAVTQ